MPVLPGPILSEEALRPQAGGRVTGCPPACLPAEISLLVCACICSSVCLYLFASVCSSPLPVSVCPAAWVPLFASPLRPGRVEPAGQRGPEGGRWQAGRGDPAPSAPRSCTPTWWSTATTTCWTPRLPTWCPRSWPARPWSSLTRPTTSVSREPGGEARQPLRCCCVRLPEPSPLPRQRLHRLHERQPHPPYPGSLPGQPGDPAEDGAQVGVPRPVDPGA